MPSSSTGSSEVTVEIRELLASLESGHPETIRDAIECLAFYLEFSTRAIEQPPELVDPNGHYLQWLPQSLIDHPADLELQKLLVGKLQLIKNDDSVLAFATWAIGKAHPRVATLPLVQRLKENAYARNDQISYQTLIGIENCLCRDGDVETCQPANQALSDFSIQEELEYLAGVQQDDEAAPYDINGVATRILRNLQIG